MSRKKISTTIYITPEQDSALKRLNARTKVPIAEFIRQGVDMVLAKYHHLLPGQETMWGVPEVLPEAPDEPARIPPIATAMRLAR